METVILKRYGSLFFLYIILNNKVCICKHYYV